MRLTTFEAFRELASRGTFVPVCREIVADLLTPVSAFLKIAGRSDHAFLLESVEGGEQVARYSFLGRDPFAVLRGRRDETLIETDGRTSRIDEPFLAVLRRTMNELRAPSVAELPRFTGGAVGYLGYDAAAWFEPAVARAGRDEASAIDPVEDLARFMVFDTILAFDHVKHRILAIANARVEPGGDLEALYRAACERTSALERELARELDPDVVLSRPDGTTPLAVESSLSQDAFEAAVGAARQAIAAGEVYQVVLSRRFEATVTADPFHVYRTLRRVNPSPYMYFMRMGDLSIVGSSPEMLVRVSGRRVETHPIAGTRPRGATEAEDERLAEELQANQKERAEHVMLVDLGRNDVGRVSRYGTVSWPRFMEVVRYSHVMHLASTVVGELADDMDRLDALAACFPAGTVSGAPKIRAMQLIAELEPEARGVYAGAIGYLDFAGNLDCCIAIRTIVMHGGTAHVQAGAGIVFDSDATAEFEETQSKASALLHALEMAEPGAPETGD